MDAAKILGLLRPLVLVVDRWGTITQASGGLEGVFGHDPADLPGTNVLNLIAPEERHDAATYFVAHAAEEVRTTLVPLPFRANVLATDGSPQPVDVIPTGCPDDPDIDGWVVVVVPVELEASPSRALDAELAGRPRSEVKQALASELTVDNRFWVSYWFLIDHLDHPQPSITASRRVDPAVTEMVATAIADGWRPWVDADPEERLFDLETLPTDLSAALVVGGWNVVGALPVRVDGEVVAALVRIGRAPLDQADAPVRTNVVSRVRGLRDVTSMLYARWRDQDRLTMAATTDSLTGLANRETLAAALASGTTARAVLYVDVDEFKSINDRHGHAVGDRVLVEVARRLKVACRPRDLVARLGGDEFVILLEGVPAEVARSIGERVVSLVAEPIELDGCVESVGVSVGLATSADGERDQLDAADRAMLAAKRAGRRRLVVA